MIDRERATGAEQVVGDPAYTDTELDAAIEALTERDRFREAEGLVARAAPQLARILAHALELGGWFAEGHETELSRATAIEDEAERSTALRTLLAEEARMGMLVGVAVGWALSEELRERRARGEGP